ncbi:MAG: PHP domain-containing protein [Mycobacteriales bacterium]|nr:PHP domain-containing protein [Frankia sp.]
MSDAPRRIDLHAHSTASDGTDPPAEVLRRARAAGVDVLALTDHDTVAGWGEARGSVPAGLTVVPGCEVSCAVPGALGDRRRVSVHVLAYLFDPDEPSFRQERDNLRDDRERRADAIVDRLIELGAPVSHDRVREIAGGGAIGRPHIARALVAAGVVSDVSAAFSDEWIGARGRAYVDKYALDPVHAVALIRAAGGVAVLAHPGAPTRGETVREDVIARMAAAGLAGIEVDHPDHTPETRTRLRELASDLGVVTTGSSDDHGALTGYRVGCETTQPYVWAELRSRASGGQPWS